MADTFEEFVIAAVGAAPRPFQGRLAAEGLPGVLQAPTGTGKTAGVVLGWLYRRLYGAPEGTPRRLVYVLPTGALAAETAGRIAGWLGRLGLEEQVGLHVLAGAGAQEGGWRRRPERTAILVGTQDLLLSRALMHGQADQPRMAAISYALLHNDAQWVFDELHLFSPAARAAGIALQRSREALGTAAPTATLWLGSTWDGRGPDGPVLRAAEGVGEVRRLRVRELVLPRSEPYAAALAAAVRAAHRPGTRTLVVVNTPARARELHRALAGSADGGPARPDPVLLHPYRRAGEEPEPGPLVVATADAAAGLELSARTVLTELAPWSALVRRAGRCNRYGEHPGGGDLLWCVPPEGGGEPAVVQWLTARDGAETTGEEFFEARIAEPREDGTGPAPAALLALFDEGAPGGAAAADAWCAPVRDPVALVAWRSWAAGDTAGPAEDEPDPGRGELCPVPLAELEPLLADRGWLRDRMDGRWRRAAAGELRPGSVVLLDAEGGGYRPAEGWWPEDRTPVAVAGGPPAPSWTFACAAWVSLDQHLQETEEEAAVLLAALADDRDPLDPAHREAVLLAARYHDLGKCHEVFQRMLRSGGGDPPAGLLAKSKAPWSTGISERPYFRHELVSALVLLAEGADFLVAYLAAAHHGKVRLAARPGPDEAPRLLGVEDGDPVPEVLLSSGERFAARVLRTGEFRPGGGWTGRATALRDRADLGPFRLAHLEMLVRIADWRSSARHDGPVPE
ncbi:CRISPR-associated endonuclease Cas3'' [Kitasatospora sp. NPDC006697]|uniref:CRISPR-associated endonuclease Cas3'' n=1 Tax=Kitasatospora sp. NPDC006697 TaxID=3364020 RepID=UPI003690D9CF